MSNVNPPRSLHNCGLHPSHLSEIYSDTKYGFLSMRTKRKPHQPYASGDTRKEELTKRLCSLVDNSQDSCKKVPSKKRSHKLGAASGDMARKAGKARKKRTAGSQQQTADRCTS